ncbi:MAG TPA: AAA family ATPase [Pseudobdellovibrionaceae bacterium]|nr:AAA family ATPase [Pseudobdellovibrionaceae bacterium]
MKIDNIVISNYKAFYGTHRFEIQGKNCLIYGENGSGKSSFYYALKDYFKSSTLTKEAAAEHNNILSKEVRNLFSTEQGKDPSFIHVSFTDEQGPLGFSWSMLNSNMEMPRAQSLLGPWAKRRPHYNGKKVFSFSDGGFDLWSHVITRFFMDFKKERGAKSFGQILASTGSALNRKHTDFWAEEKKKRFDLLCIEIEAIVSFLNENLKTQLSYFDKSIKVEIIFKNPSSWIWRFLPKIKFPDKKGFKLGPNYNLNSLVKKWFDVKIKYHSREIPAVAKSHLFLNEARRSAICLSAMLASLKTLDTEIPYKYLILDDILVGLDNSLRMSFMEALEKEFRDDYQIFLLTYDRSWFELNSRMLDSIKWQFLEMYRDTVDDLKIPNVRVLDKKEPLDTAHEFYNQKSYALAAHCLRVQFEKLLSNQSLPNLFRLSKKEVGEITVENMRSKSLADSFQGLEDWANQFTSPSNGIEKIRKLKGLLKVLMNPSSHSDAANSYYIKELDELFELEKWLRDNLKKPLERQKPFIPVNSEVRVRIPSSNIVGKSYNWYGVLVEPFTEKLWNGTTIKNTPKIQILGGFAELANGEYVQKFENKTPRQYSGFYDLWDKVIDFINESSAESTKFDGETKASIESNGRKSLSMVQFKIDGYDWQPVNLFFVIRAMLTAVTDEEFAKLEAAKGKQSEA